MDQNLKECVTNMLIQDEGEKLFPYKDQKNLITIGIGRCLDRIGITHDESLYLFNNDLRRVLKDLTTYFPWYESLTPVRQAAMINLCFNLGIANLSKFKKFLAAMEQGLYLTAKTELLDSLYAKQLPNRSKRVAQMIMTGEWVHE
jgi:lysozyme